MTDKKGGDKKRNRDVKITGQFSGVRTEIWKENKN
jgi:hypothetical protein